jgi:hypothetical protein
MYVLWQDAAVVLGVTSGGLQSAYNGKGEVAGGGLEGTNVMLPVGRHPTRIALDDAWNASLPSEFSQAAVRHCERLRKVTAGRLLRVTECCATDLLEPKLNAKITHTHTRSVRKTNRSALFSKHSSVHSDMDTEHANTWSGKHAPFKCYSRWYI